MPQAAPRTPPAILAHYGQIPGLLFWMEAQRESWANAATVTSLVDRSGCGNSVGGGSGTTTFATGEQAGKPAVVFSGSYLTVAPAFCLPASNSITVYVVAKMVGTGARQTFLYFGNAANSGPQILCDSSNKFRLTHSQQAEIGASATSMSTSAYELWAVTYNGDTANFYRNGVLDATAATSRTFSYTSTPTLNIGANSGPGEFLSGKTPLILAYDGCHDNRLLNLVFARIQQSYALY